MNIIDSEVILIKSCIFSAKIGQHHIASLQFSISQAKNVTVLRKIDGDTVKHFKKISHHANEILRPITLVQKHINEISTVNTVFQRLVNEFATLIALVQRPKNEFLTLSGLIQRLLS